MKIYIFILFLSICFMSSCSNEKETDPIERAEIGIFGGSISCYPGSEIIRSALEKELNVIVGSYGYPGAGFMAGENSICDRIKAAKSCDVYILWASTNDMVWAKIGELNSNDSTSQNGGIRRAVRLIKEKNNMAKILFLTSLPRFDEYFTRVAPYVEAQKEVCENLNISFLEQNKNDVFNWNNYEQYYLEDKTHFNNSGYQLILNVQMPFLLQQLDRYKKREN